LGELDAVASASDLAANTTRIREAA
jgi:hypothetical protein